MLHQAITYLKYLKETEGDIIYINKDAYKTSEEKDNVTQNIVNEEKYKYNTIMSNEQVVIKTEVKANTVAPDWISSKTLPELNSKINKCLECPLGPTRTKFVFGVGNPDADIMVIGEAPGKDEDEQGEPFVGRAGQLLTKILNAIDLQREDVYIANIIKCRPPDNRRPNNIEIEKCEPYLKKQIELIKPKFILALGLTAACTLLKNNYRMGDIRGKSFDYAGVEMLVTYHPAALLRNPNWKKDAWEDVKLLRKKYDEYIKTK